MWQDVDPIDYNTHATYHDPVVAQVGRLRTPKDYRHVLERHDLATVLVARFSKVDTLYVCGSYCLF